MQSNSINTTMSTYSLCTDAHIPTHAAFYSLIKVCMDARVCVYVGGRGSEEQAEEEGK